MNWIILVAAAALQTPAETQGTPGDSVVPRQPLPTVVRQPLWLAKPSSQDYARVYPERARRMDKGGRVVVRCTATAEGAMSKCIVLSETPAHNGFAEAALAVMPLFLMQPTTEEGANVAGAYVTIPVTFVPQ
jgi:protein TonB